MGRECAVVTKLDSFRTSVVRHGGLGSYQRDFLDVAGRIVSLHASWIFFEGLQSVRRWEVRIKKKIRGIMIRNSCVPKKGPRFCGSENSMSEIPKNSLISEHST